MRIVFVRHGEPDYEHDCLTPAGREQALAAAKKAVRNHPSYRFHRQQLEDGTDCFEVVEGSKVIERHIKVQK